MFHSKFGVARLLPVLALGAVSVSCDNPDAIRDLLEKLGKGGGGAKTCGGAAGATCGTREFCDLGKGSCAAGSVGVCQIKPDVCDAIFAPVCGCDGRTYGNDCQRQGAGVALASKGECGPPGVGKMCGGFTGIPCPDGLFCDPPPDSCHVAAITIENVPTEMPQMGLVKKLKPI